MAINYPTFDFLNEQAQAELARQRPDIDPSIFGSFARSFTTSGSALAYTLTLTLRDIEKQAFPQTATGGFLDIIGGYEPLSRNAASPAFGSVSMEGTFATVIPGGTSFLGVNNLVYASTAAADVQNFIFTVLSIVRSGSTVTVITDDDNTYATGLIVEISGVVETDYNGAFEITVVARNSFTYEISTTPTSPATGTISSTSTYAVIPIESDDVGQVTNLSSGAQLNLVTPIVGMSDPAIVQFDGITGGAEIEDDDSYRERIILSRSIIEGVFTVSQIKLVALSITGNTRAFVVRAQLSATALPVPGFIPSPGQVAVYILRDNDVNILPSQPVLDATKARIIAEGALPANSSETDVFVFAPVLVETDYDFLFVTPNTESMRLSVIAVLEAFYKDIVEFEKTITEERYLGAIDQTVDLSTGLRIEAFELTAPTGDIVIALGEIGTLGTVTFP